MNPTAVPFSNKQISQYPDELTIHFKFTAAADVAANGYTVNKGAGFISSVTRSAEGVIVITLKDKYPSLLGATLHCSKDDTYLVLDSEAVLASGTVTWTARTGGADVDPDSAVFYGSITVLMTPAITP